MNITGMDHIVLTVQDPLKTARFYESVLGMTVEIYGENRLAVTFGKQKINLHPQGKEFEPKAAAPKSGSGDLCFITDTPLKDAMAHVQSMDIVIIEGPVERSGAAGPINSFYFRDLDGNLIEVANRADTE